MATLNITEAKELAQDVKGQTVLALKMPAAAVQNVTFTTAAQSSAFGGLTQFVRLVADADCWALFGSDPTATASNATRLEANVAEIFGVNPGDKVSAYDGSS